MVEKKSMHGCWRLSRASVENGCPVTKQRPDVEVEAGKRTQIEKTVVLAPTAHLFLQVKGKSGITPSCHKEGEFAKANYSQGQIPVFAV